MSHCNNNTFLKGKVVEQIEEFLNKCTYVDIPSYRNAQKSKANTKRNI